MLCPSFEFRPYLTFHIFALQARNAKVSFIWTQFSALNSYFTKRAQDEKSFNQRVAEVLSSLSSLENTNSTTQPASNNSRLNEILSHTDARIKKLYNELPSNSMLIISTGHGDTAIPDRYAYRL